MNYACFANIFYKILQVKMLPHKKEKIVSKLAKNKNFEKIVLKYPGDQEMHATNLHTTDTRVDLS
jgi:hypothetical protein